MRGSLVLAGLCVALAALPGRAQETATTFTIDFGVVEVEGARVVADAWIDARVAEANRVFAPCAVAFVRGETYAIPSEHARLETRADRNRLSAHVRPDVIDLFVVATLMDVDEPGRERRGVHWRERGTGTHYVIVSAIAAWPSIFAHELGHYFGEPHSDTPNDVMSYEHDDVTPTFFDAGQVRRVRRRARAYVESGELRAR